MGIMGRFNLSQFEKEYKDDDFYHLYSLCSTPQNITKSINILKLVRQTIIQKTICFFHINGAVKVTDNILQSLS